MDYHMSPNHMMAAAVITRESNRPELTVGFFALSVLAGCGCWVFIQWLRKGPVTPDPWDGEIAAGLEKQEAMPLCNHCLSPHNANTDFCPECGAAVGQYTNWLPYPYLFSIGHALRIGTAGEFKHSPLTISGFLLLGLAEYSIFSPFYWFVFLRSLFRRSPTPTSEP
jgi:hypothetical protein